MEITYNDVTYNLPSHIPYKTDNNACLIKLNLNTDGLNEGVWAVIHEDDLKDYEDNILDSDYKRICVIANFALCGIPAGAYIPYKMQGHSRPVCEVNSVLAGSDKFVFCEDHKPND